MAGLKKKFENIAQGGKGLGFDPLAADMARLAELPVGQIEPDPDQPRKDVGDIDDLKASITEHGILQPILVSVVAEDQYRLIAGERRLTAAKAVGLKTVPCIVRTVEEHRRLEVQLIENLHRKELNPVEEATTYKRLMTEFNLSQRQLGERLGKSAATINQTVRILSLPQAIIEEASHGNESLTRSVLLEIAKLETEEEQLRLFERARKGLLTVKAARDKKADVSEKKPKAKYPIRTKAATVLLTFDSGEVPEPNEILEILQEAFDIEKKKAKGK
jgi:ParB family chromosome partitioning protein